MKKTFIAIMMMAGCALSANANTMGPVDPEFEAWVYMQVAAGQMTVEQAEAAIVNHMNGDYGIDTYAIANPNNNKNGKKNNGGGGTYIPEEEIPYSLDPTIPSGKGKGKKK